MRCRVATHSLGMRTVMECAYGNAHIKRVSSRNHAMLFYPNHPFETSSIVHRLYKTLIRLHLEYAIRASSPFLSRGSYAPANP